MEDNNCIFCKNPDCKSVQDSGKGIYKVICRFCGTYLATEELDLYIGITDGKALINKADESKEYDVYVIQGAIKEHNLNNHIPYLTWGNLGSKEKMTIDDLLNSVNVPSGPVQKMDKFLENIDKESKSIPGRTLSLKYDTGKNRCYARDIDEFRECK